MPIAPKPPQQPDFLHPSENSAPKAEKTAHSPEDDPPTIP
jgi:hypothetical protein